MSKRSNEIDIMVLNYESYEWSAGKLVGRNK